MQATGAAADVAAEMTAAAAAASAAASGQPAMLGYYTEHCGHPQLRAAGQTVYVQLADQSAAAAAAADFKRDAMSQVTYCVYTI